MPSTAQAHMEQHYKKQFIVEMQGKGKLPRFPTDASERKVCVCRAPLTASADSGLWDRAWWGRPGREGHAMHQSAWRACA